MAWLETTTATLFLMQHTDMKKNIKLQFDGSCEPKNPGGNMGMGCVISDYDTGEVLAELSEFVAANARNSNNVAEYEALILGLQWLGENGYQKNRVRCYGDSMLVVNQINGEWRAKGGLYFDSYQTAKQLFKGFRNIEIRWHGRDQNADADRLSRAHVSDTEF